MTPFKANPQKYPHPFFEGNYAREFGAERTDNPYAEGTKEHDDWDTGWGSVDELPSDEDK